MADAWTCPELQRCPLVVDIQDVLTGQHIQYATQTFCEETGSLFLYAWTEGNFGCDCNRAQIFARALGKDAPEDPPCGEEQFVVQLIDPATGTVVYTQPGWTAPEQCT